MHTLKKSLECIFSQENVWRTPFVKTEMYSIIGFWITSYWVLVLPWWESLTWDFLVRMTRSCYDHKGKGIHISALKRMSLLLRERLSILLHQDISKQNSCSFSVHSTLASLNKRMIVQFVPLCFCMVLLLSSILSASICVVNTLTRALTITKSCQQLHYIFRNKYAYLTSRFLFIKIYFNDLRAMALGQSRSWFLKKVHCRQIPEDCEPLFVWSHQKEV